MTCSKELRRIQAAIAAENQTELRWALAQCEVRKSFRKKHSDRWYQIEKRIRSLLTATDDTP